MWDVKEPKHYSKRVGREVPGVVAVLYVVDTGPMLIAVTTITEMVILYKYVEINQPHPIEVVTIATDFFFFVESHSNDVTKQV